MLSTDDLTKIANLTKEQLLAKKQLDKLRDEILSKDEEASIEQIVYSLPTQEFVAIKDNKTGDWVTTDDSRFVFKKQYTNNTQQTPMLPVGIINLETKALVLFDLGEKKYREEKDMANSRLVSPFYPGFFLMKNIDGNCPPYTVNLKRDIYTWFHYESKKIKYTYEWVVPSNPEQIQEVGTPIIGYIPFLVGVTDFSHFEFYQAYN